MSVKSAARLLNDIIDNPNTGSDRLHYALIDVKNAYVKRLKNEGWNKKEIDLHIKLILDV